MNYNAAVQRNSIAMSNIFRLAEDAGELIDFADAKQAGRPFAVPERVKTTEEFMAQFGRDRETK